jgi:hypothetical protein
MSRDLAQIGVLGHQLDVTRGGDVNPATGRLLSLAELQQALRAVRRGPAPASMPTGHVAPRNGRQTGLPELADPAPDTTPPEPADLDDLDDLDDLYGWQEQDQEKPDAQLASTPHPSPAGRSWRRWTDVALLARRRPPRTATRQGTVALPRGARARRRTAPTPQPVTSPDNWTPSGVLKRGTSLSPTLPLNPGPRPRWTTSRSVRHRADS